METPESIRDNHRSRMDIPAYRDGFKAGRHDQAQVGAFDYPTARVFVLCAIGDGNAEQDARRRFFCYGRAAAWMSTPKA